MEIKICECGKKFAYWNDSMNHCNICRKQPDIARMYRRKQRGKTHKHGSKKCNLCGKWVNKHAHNYCWSCEKKVDLLNKKIDAGWSSGSSSGS